MKQKKLSARILSLVLTVAMVVTMLIYSTMCSNAYQYTARCSLLKEEHL